MSDKKDCKHERFQCQCNVTRLTDKDDREKITGYTTDIKVWCTECGQAFEWVGVPGGYSPSKPMVSIDGLELRAPIRPVDHPIEKDPNKIYN